MSRYGTGTINDRRRKSSECRWLGCDYSLLIITAGLSFVADASLAQNLSAEQVMTKIWIFFSYGRLTAKTPDHALPECIGIQGQKQEAGFLVTSVLEGYPAHRAGLNRGDIITSIDGQHLIRYRF